MTESRSISVAESAITTSPQDGLVNATGRLAGVVGSSKRSRNDGTGHSSGSGNLGIWRGVGCAVGPCETREGSTGAEIREVLQDRRPCGVE